MGARVARRRPRAAGDARGGDPTAPILPAAPPIRSATPSTPTMNRDDSSRRVDLDGLQIFDAVMREKHVTRAAERLSLSVKTVETLPRMIKPLQIPTLQAFFLGLADDLMTDITNP